MKQITCTLLLLLVAIPLFAQSSLTELHQDNRNGIRGGMLTMDSIVTVQDPSGSQLNIQKFIYTYDNSGNVESYIYQTWDGGDWENVRRETYAYNSMKLRTETVIEDFQSNQWQYIQKQLTEYNAAGSQTSYLAKSWINNEWSNNDYDQWSVSEYDSNQLLTANLYYQWLNGQWNDSYKIVHSYSNDLLKESSVHYEWDNQWIEDDKTEFVYDGNDNMIELQTFDWVNNSYWKVYQKIEYTYDANGKETEQIQSFWENNAWAVSRRFITEYNVDELISKRSMDYWSNSAWDPFYEFTNTYDELDNLIEYVYNFSWSGTEWSYREKYILDYDLDVDPYFILDPDGMDGSKLLTTKLHQFNNGSWIYYNEKTHYYSGESTPSGLSKEPFNDFMLYPNPSSDFINLELSTANYPLHVIIHDMKGALVHTASISDKQMIDVRSLKSGSYIVHLKGANLDRHSRIIISRP